MMEGKKPKHFLVLKIIGFLGITCAIVGFILVVTGFGNFKNNNFMIGGFLSCFGLFIGGSCLFAGFSPEITKIGTKSAKYIQEQNKDDLTNIAETSAQIASGAVTTVAKAVKKGIKDTMFCKECGKEIERDSKFCKECGKEQ